jgi:hypothetical protein
LPHEEAQQIAKHISNCEKCLTMLKALQDSLKMVQDIWEDDKEKWGDLHSFKKPKLQRLHFKSIAVAAGIILICSVSLTWLELKPNQSRQVTNEAPTIEEIIIESDRAAIAAQLLAVGDMYAAQPGAEKYAMQRYNNLIESFPSSAQSEQAKLHLKKLLERKIQ